MSQNLVFSPQMESRIANKREFEEMLQFEENICISYRFNRYGCFVFLILCFPLTDKPNYPSPELFRGAALFSQDAELLDVENPKLELPEGSRI